MRPILALLLLSLCPAVGRASAALTDTTDVLKKAREFTPYVSQNSPGPLWAAFDANMRAAMQDSLSFAQTLDAIHVTVEPSRKTSLAKKSRNAVVYRRS
jgi:hypothetical protein